MEFSATMPMNAPASSPSSSSALFFSLSPSPTPKTVLFNLLSNKPQIPVIKSLKCIQSDWNPRNQRISPFACSAVTFSPAQIADQLVRFKLQRLIAEFESLSEPVDRVKRLLHYASFLPSFDNSERVDSNRVMGCTAQVWLEARIDFEGKMRFRADSDSEISKGFCSCLVKVLDGATPEEVLSVKTEDLAALNVGIPGGERSRVNTWHNVLISMQKRTKGLVAEREGKAPFEPFPSLVVTSDGIQANGSYAETQFYCRQNICPLTNPRLKNLSTC